MVEERNIRDLSMKKTDKKRAEDFLKTVDTIHTSIRKMLHAGNRAVAMELLEQCQGLAIRAGEMIEGAEGEGFITVTLIESYCELVYKSYEEIRWSQTINEDRIYNLLASKLIQVGKSIKHDIPVRREAVFLPYKASMWDSLESIWKAAEEDPYCDAYVIPIPYYDKKPDGSVGDRHYEGDLYPDYVPVIDYQSYDFAEHHPDFIFIHNPYDDCNSVTTVLPFFYSSNLKQFTEKLVYVPYFILGEIDPDNEHALDSIAHFCILPGVIHAHRVIVQSESMRQAYIKVLTGEFGERSRRYWENKILGLGSPKTDRVVAAKKEDQKIPEEWMKIICRPDGCRKKIILYNTSITALLQHDEKMLKKMTDVFHVFKENQEEVALLWRPHPLIRETIGALRPQLWEAYKKMSEQYRREGWGIYDDTADVDRAIAVSDAYYGDGSSLVNLCQSVGMLVMIQDVNILG